MKDKFMKTKTIRFSIIIIVCMVLGVLSSCGINEQSHNKGTRMLVIDGYISYDSNTNVVYYYCSGSYMTPYYSENGKLCRYIDGKIVEIK